MAATKHTTGPWKVETKSVSVRIIVGPDLPTTEEIRWRLYGGEDAEADKETIANAHLIAAAPDLLEALKSVVRIADRKTVEFDAARAAIRKAEGDDVDAAGELPANESTTEGRAK